jgi:hypothetical protein
VLTVILFKDCSMVKQNEWIQKNISWRANMIWIAASTTIILKSRLHFSDTISRVQIYWIIYYMHHIPTAPLFFMGSWLRIVYGLRNMDRYSWSIDNTMSLAVAMSTSFSYNQYHNRSVAQQLCCSRYCQCCQCSVL